jgi:acetoacetyl-CoA synthetase
MMAKSQASSFEELLESPELMWSCNPEFKAAKSMTGFREYCNGTYSLNMQNFKELYEFSVNDLSKFWAAVWSYCDIVASKPYTYVLQTGVPMSKIPKWFLGARLNYAENAL